MTRRLHHPALPDTNTELELSEAATRHAKVLRLAVGDPLVLFDGAGREADARILRLGDHLRCAVDAAREVASIHPRVVLCVCVPKGAKLEQVVRGATEVGVVAVHLAISERCVARPSGDAFKKLERLRRIAQEAARQSGRASVPDVLAAAPLAEVAGRADPCARRLVAVPGAAPLEGVGDEAWLIVGPEGGLSPGEQDHLVAAGWTPIGLGPSVMRAETAAVVGAALVGAALRRGDPSRSAAG